MTPFGHSRKACPRESGERESRKINPFWTPASAGVTALDTFYDTIKFKLSYLFVTFEACRISYLSDLRDSTGTSEFMQGCESLLDLPKAPYKGGMAASEGEQKLLLMAPVGNEADITGYAMPISPRHTSNSLNTPFQHQN